MGEEFDRLKKKYNLPSFEVLNNELDLSGSEEAENLLRWIMKQMGDRLEFFSDMVGNLLQPDSNPSNIYELSAFSEEEREKLPRIYKDLMFLHREYIEQELNYKEENCALFILHFMKEWEGLKKDLTSILGVMKRSWKGENALKSDLVYYG